MDGIVYDDGSGSGATMYATNEVDGSLVWSQPNLNGGDDSSPAVDGSNVYVTFPDQYYAFNRTTGAPVWHDDLGGYGGGGRTPVVADGHVYIRDWTASPFIAASATGANQGSMGSTTAPAVGNGTAYELDGSTLTAVADDGLGANSWSFTGDGHLDSAPIVTANAAWVGSASGELYAVNCSDGQAMWSTNVGSAIPAPDEQNVSQPLTGLGAGGNLLVVPAGSALVAYTSSNTSNAGSCGSAEAAAPAPVGGTSGSGTGGSTSGPQPTSTRSAQSPARRREIALLRRDLMLDTTVRQLLAHRGRLSLRLSLPGAGKLALAWALAPAGRPAPQGQAPRHRPGHPQARCRRHPAAASSAAGGGRGRCCGLPADAGREDRREAGLPDAMVIQTASAPDRAQAQDGTGRGRRAPGWRSASLSRRSSATSPS